MNKWISLFTGSCTGVESGAPPSYLMLIESQAIFPSLSLSSSCEADFRTISLVVVVCLKQLLE